MDANKVLVDYLINDDIEEIFPSLIEVVSVSPTCFLAGPFANTDEIMVSTGKTSPFMKKIKAFSDEDFVKYLRVSKKIFTKLYRLLEKTNCQVIHTGGKVPIPLEDVLAFTLIYLGSSSLTFKEIGLIYQTTWSESSIYRRYMMIIQTLNEILPDIIKWPSKHEMAVISEEFCKLSSISGIVGVVDSCFININPPEKDKELYTDKYSNRSVNLLAVCDNTYKFTYIATGMPGSVPKEQCLNSCSLGNICNTDPPSLFADDSYYLVGSNCFPLKTCIITPYRSPSAHEEVFNRHLLQARKVSDLTFKLLKTRFRRLEKIYMTKADTARSIISACCVLHNIILQSDSDLACFQRDNENVVTDANFSCDEPDDPNAFIKRHTIMNSFFSRFN